MPFPQKSRPICILGPLFLVFFVVAGAARGQSVDVPDLLAQGPATEQFAQYTGKPIRRLELLTRGRWFRESLSLRWVKVSEPFSLPYLRSAVRDLLDTGHLARADIHVTPMGDGVEVLLKVELRRVIADLSVSGAAIADEDLFDAANLRVGSEITDSGIDEKLEAIRRIHAERGFPNAKVALRLDAKEASLDVRLHFDVEVGEPMAIVKRRFEVAPEPEARGLPALLRAYEVQSGDNYDEPRLVAADRELAETLKHAGWYEARVSHQIARKDAAKNAGIELSVQVIAGPKFDVAFLGNNSFDVDRLRDVLEIDTNDDRSVESFLERLRKHYVSYGFLDVAVTVNVSNGSGHNKLLTFTINEGQGVRVVRREYPCLTGRRSSSDLDAEIDSFLAEELPGAELLGPIDPQKLDQTIGPKASTGARPVPLNPNPYVTYVPRVYERALKHVQDLYRSEGYLAATVGPVQLQRRRCAIGSPPGQCHPIGLRQTSPLQCRYDDIQLPLDEPFAASEHGCAQDLKRGRFCESEVVVAIPIKLGPQTVLWDVAFDGNQRVTEQELGQAVALPLGKPLPLTEVEQGRRRLLDAYAELGFAYADVTAAVETSPDHTRARVRFSIREGELVRIGDVLLRGAKYTSERLLRSRITLKSGQPYRRSEVRSTEERLGTLGVFSTVRVGLEDPYVPAREKNVVIEVVERIPQYIEPRIGFSTGEGIRSGFDYGHLNIVGKAVQLTLRTRVSYLPDALILEPDVQAKYQSDVSRFTERLERMISLQVTFPDIGLGPLFRLGVEGLDVHDNQRDFGLTKEALVPTLTYQPNRRVTIQLSSSLERNDVSIFGNLQQNALTEYVQAHPERNAVFRVPQGTTGAIAERITASWDRRDVALDARSGTFATTSIEHVTAQPLGSSQESASTGDAYCTGGSAPGRDNPFAPTDSEFLRWMSRLAGYIPLTRKGTSLAISFRWGMNYQLKKCSRTYPDRLFFLGGVDSIRGFLQGSLVPEDIAQQLLAPVQPGQQGLSINQVVIRGGNFFINPRAELRLPLNKLAETVVFLDAGNVWSSSPTDAKVAGDTYVPNYLRLRYAVGTGLRLNTPVGPLALDYGLNVERVLDRLYPNRKNQRYWEDLGALSFSIGLF